MSDTPETVYITSGSYFDENSVALGFAWRDLAENRVAFVRKDLADKCDAELEAKQNWQTTETPPEVGTSVLVYLPEEDLVLTATYVIGKWMSRGEEVFPSHWMPLPDAPKREQNDG